MAINTQSGWTVYFDGSKYTASVNGTKVSFQLLSQLEDWLSRIPVTLDDWWYLYS